MSSNSFQNIFISLLLILIAINLLIIDIKIFTNPTKIAEISTIVTPTTSPASKLVPNNSLCPASCVSLISQATVSSQKDLTATKVVTANSQREFYIPLGSGSTQKGDWDDINSSDTLIDTSKYGTIKEAYFIASLRNPTQNGDSQVRLYNVTDKHMVWNTEMKMNGPLSETLTSPKITLDTGTKLYRVQLKSGLGYPVYLDNGRIRLIAE